MEIHETSQLHMPTLKMKTPGRTALPTPTRGKRTTSCTVDSNATNYDVELIEPLRELLPNTGTILAYEHTKKAQEEQTLDIHTKRKENKAIRRANARARKRKSRQNRDVRDRERARARAKYSSLTIEERKQIRAKAVQRKIEKAMSKSTAQCDHELLPVHGNLSTFSCVVPGAKVRGTYHVSTVEQVFRVRWHTHYTDDGVELTSESKFGFIAAHGNLSTVILPAQIVSDE